MKIFAVVFIMIFLGSPIYAQIQSPSPSPSASPAPIVSPTATLIPSPVTSEPRPSDKDKKLKYSLAGFYSLGSYLNVGNLTVVSGGSSGTGSENFNLATSFGLSAEVTNSPENNWGWLGGINYEFGRSFNSFNLSGSNGFSATGVYQSPNPSVALLIFYGGAVYRWTNIYIPFGINFNVPFFQSGAASSGTFSFSGGLGGQAGFGYEFADNLALEFDLQYLTFSGSATAGTVGENLSGITFWDPIFRLKYTF